MKPQFRDVRDRLKYVKTKDDDYDLSGFPDFMAIGPQRTGTTWLGDALRAHPHVFIPWQKEVHYFNNLEYPEYHSASLPPIDQELGWYLGMFRLPDRGTEHCERRTRRLFGHAYEPRMFGDFTATYAAALHDGIIDEILLLNPDVRIIVLVRDPIERGWSHAFKDLCTQRERTVEQVPEAEWLEFFNREYQINCGNYSQWLARWQNKVPRQNMLVARFADIKADPRGLLQRVHGFLGLPTGDKYIADDVGVRRAGLSPGLSAKATRSSDIPPKLRAELERLFGEESARLREQGLV